METIINISGVITREDDEQITDAIMDKVLILLESNGYQFNGGWKLQTEDEYLNEIKPSL